VVWEGLYDAIGQINLPHKHKRELNDRRLTIEPYTLESTPMMLSVS
jgi:hypothetical protein